MAKNVLFTNTSMQYHCMRGKIYLMKQSDGGLLGAKFVLIQIN